MNFKDGGYKLGSDQQYIRPKKTLTDTMQSKDAISEQLRGYVAVEDDDVNFLSMNTHVRYITMNPETGQKMFRFGGFVKKIAREYIVLSGKDGKTFSVQRYILDGKGNILYRTQFYKKEKRETLLEKELEEEKKKLDEVVEQYEKNFSAVDKIKRENMMLKKRLEKLDSNRK